VSLSFARLRPVHVALLSVAYWIGLAAVKLSDAILAIAQVALPGMHGNVGAELKNLFVLTVTVVRGGTVTWTGSASLPVLFAWIVGPPLILALTARWARQMETEEAAADAMAIQSPGPIPLGAPPPDWQGRIDQAPGRSAGTERRRTRDAEL